MVEDGNPRNMVTRMRGACVRAEPRRTLTTSLCAGKKEVLNLWHQNLALLEQNGEKMAKPEKSTVTYPWAGLRVLVADDVLVNADILRNMLVSFGLVVDVAYRGDEALERLMG